MQDVKNYKSIVEAGGYSVETKLLVNGVQFEVVSMSVHNSLFGGGSLVGACVSGEIDAAIVALSADIPRMAKLEPFVRVVKDGRKSDWMPKGTYYIDTRHEDVATGILTVHGYDAMTKAEMRFTAADIKSWGNKIDAAVVDLIATRIGVELDSRTELGERYTIPTPSTDDSAESLRTVLGYIGAAYGGNWIITFDNKLLLLKLGAIPPETYYLCDNGGSFLTFGGDRIVL